MAALHDALKSLSPVSFSDVPQAPSERDNFVEELFKQAQLIAESIPPPANDPKAPVKARTTPAVNASEISPSAYRSAAPIPEYAALQKEWGKPLSVSAKDNPLAIPVYKLSAKDKKGAWFARRSVHEGLGFERWKKGLEREFPESTIIQGLPGEGNIRGIGGEKRVENIPALGGTAKMEVYHLSAQFPGPTTPRDFVTFLVTSSSAMKDLGPNARPEHLPRHYMIISKPCEHPKTPATDAFIRGKYESVEFIREVPRRPRKSRSSVDLRRLAADIPSFDRAATMSHPDQKANSSTSELLNKDANDVRDSSLRTAAHSLSDEELARRRSRSRGRGSTISFAESRGRSAKGEALDNPNFDDDSENNPVEWIMITRSDPGGNIPRFMIERGTPSSIVADAVKFLDWACKKDHPEIDPLEEAEQKSGQLERQETFESWQTNGHLAGLAEEDDHSENATMHDKQVQQEPLTSSGVLGGISAVVGSYAPSVQEYLPGQPTQNDSTGLNANADNDAVSTISGTSFASADSHLHEEEDNQSISSKTSPAKDEPRQLSQHEKELEKLAARRKALDEKLAAARDKSNKETEAQIAKEQEAIRKAEDKHNREIKKQEEKHRKEIDKLERKRSRERKKTEDRRRKQADKDEKAKLTRERDEARSELEVLKKEREIWLKQVGDLQQQNTRLTALLGSGGPRGSQDSLVSNTKSNESPALPTTPSKDAIRHLIEEERGQSRLRSASFESGVASSGNRSRSGSLRRGDH